MVPYAAHAQLAQEYFPSDIPGYSADFSASVVARQQNQDRPQGVEIDSFVINPRLSEGVGYNSNTLGIPGSGSASVNTNGSLQIRSDWTRNAIATSFTVADNRYLDLPSASYTNWTAAAGGSLTIGRGAADLAYSHLGLHLAATDLGVFGVVTPVPYSVDDARIGYTALSGRFSLHPSFEFENFAFGKSSGTPQINYDSLSHREETGTLTGRYELSTGNAVVAVLRGAGAQFFALPGTIGNDYTDVAGFGGLDFRSDSLVEYRALVGVENRSFKAPGTASATTPTVELDAVWTPSRLDTLTASVSRRFDDPASPFARNQTITDARLQYDHELRHDVFLRGYAEVGQSASESGTSTGASIDQTQLHFGATATWDINRFLKAALTYGYSNSAVSNTSETNAIVYGGGRTTFTSNSVVLSATISE